MKTLMLLCMILSLAVANSLGGTWYIQPDGTGDAPTIQAGIDSAAVGDTVLVGCGTYDEHEIRMKSGVCLRSQTGEPDCVTIDADRLGRVIVCVGLGWGTVIEGFTITRGRAEGSVASGAGIFCDSSEVTVIRCILSLNQAQVDGAGMRCSYSSSATLIGCVFHANYAEGFAGGLNVNKGASAILEDCTFSENSSLGPGGGLYCARISHCQMAGCTFQGNTALSGGALVCSDTGTLVEVSGCDFLENYAYSYGGGAIWADATITLSDCLFEGNVTDGGVLGHGGAINTHYSGTVSNCTFKGNSAELTGGALYCLRKVPWAPTVTLEGCVFSGNSADVGGVIYVGTAYLEGSGCTFYWNSAASEGSCLSGDGDTFLENCIIAYGNDVEAVEGRGDYSVTLSCCDVYGNIGGDWVGAIAGQCGLDGNFSACPSFCVAGMGDLNLCNESPCLPGNHPDGYDCGLIGALGQGCDCGPTVTERTSWGAIKSAYR